MAQENLKIRNLRRDARIGISVCDERNPYRSAIVSLIGPERVLLQELPFEHPGAA